MIKIIMNYHWNNCISKFMILTCTFFILVGGIMIWNILEHYNPFLVKFLQSVGSNVKFMVHLNENVQYYLLVDGIYPCQSIFVQVIHKPHPKKNKLICTSHNYCRKDVEGVWNAIVSLLHYCQSLWTMWS